MTQQEPAEYERLRKQSALPGKGGLARFGRAFSNTIGGFREGLATQAGIKQEAALTVVALPVSFFVADNVWTWLALMGSLVLLLAAEFLNTAIELLCNHLHPGKHDAHQGHQGPRVCGRVLRDRADRADLARCGGRPSGLAAISLL